MQAHLIYNTQAGSINGCTVEALQSALEQVGYAPVCSATESEAALDDILEDISGLVVVAGGDGSVRAVVTRLIGKKDVPLAILPMGTANNIARTLNIPLDPLAIIAGLKEPQPFPFDIGRVRAPWGYDYFIEGAGFGFFADILATYDPEQGKSVWRGLEALRDIYNQSNAYQNDLYLQGEELSGDFLLVEVLNTTAVGPRLQFAQGASPGDGLLDLVCIQNSDKESFFHYLTGIFKKNLDRLETVTRRQVKNVCFNWKGFAMHIDGEVRPYDWLARQERANMPPESRHLLPTASGEIEIDLIPGAITMWLPSMANGMIM